MLKLKFANSNSFDKVYEDMLLQFPPSELKPFETFCNLLEKGCSKLIIAYQDETPVGYIIVYSDDATNTLWLDYIAVLKKYHSKGYGGEMLKALKDLFNTANGIFLEVEKPDENDIQTLKRIKFYKKHGAELLDVNYLYPNKDGYLPMDLYYIPYTNQKVEVFKVISNVFSAIHKDIPHVDKILNLIKGGRKENAD